MVGKIHRRKLGKIALSIGVLGVVFGDIGTSPLYALQASIAIAHVSLNPSNIYGIVSLIVWAITIVVSMKYIVFIMSADNRGEGGILALIGLLRQKLSNRHNMKWLLLLGFIGLSLFYGDSVITPAISVLSAVEGLKIVLPTLSYLIIPITLIVLVILFVIQSRGSSKIGSVFGPIMTLWFIVSGLVGLDWIIKAPSVLGALSPITAVNFIMEHPSVAFLALGAVILALTGAEALYADMGHFTRAAVRRSWFVLVYPALLLNYLGQGALVALHPSAVTSSYFLLFPGWAQGAALVLATVATVIASQAVIAGAFSLTSQAARLGFVPPMHIKHTSDEEVGQVYIGSINWVLFIMVVGLVLGFRTSIALADAYGMAVSGTFLITTILFIVLARYVLRWRWWQVAGYAVIFGSVDVLFVISGLSKLFHGAWIPLTIGFIALILVTTWTKGIGIVTRERARREGSIELFVQKLRGIPELARTPGVSVYLSGHSKHAPLAMHETVEQLHELSQHVIVVTVHVLDIPHVRPHERAVIDELGYPNDGIAHVTLRFGYDDSPNVPRTLETLKTLDHELEFSFEDANYFVSSSDLAIIHDHRMSLIRKRIFLWLYRNGASPITYFHLPLGRTIDMASYIEL